jgi:hypothetical protein
MQATSNKKKKLKYKQIRQAKQAMSGDSLSYNLYFSFLLLFIYVVFDWLFGFGFESLSLSLSLTL